MISIIIPVYNCKEYIDRCINSIVTAKRNEELEILIIDDGSDDGSDRICDEQAKKCAYVKVFHQENKGVSAARNKGIETATGKYVMFIDCDDTIDRNYCESFMKHSELADERVIIIGRIIAYSNGNTAVEGESFSSEIIMDRDSLVKIWDKHLWNSPVNKLYILGVIKAGKIEFDNKYKIGEDWLFNNAYARALKPEGYYIPSESYYNYYLDPDPWRHCKPEEFYYINKNQVDDFKRTIVELELSEESVWKFDKRDMDFTISEIRRIVRNGEKAGKARKLYSEERIKARIKEHRADFSKMDVLEFSSGSVLFIYLWENTRKIYGKVRSRLNG